jgi:hypothetical protein
MAVERKIERSTTEKIIISAIVISNVCLCTFVINSLFAAPNPVFFEKNSVLEKAYHMTLEAYVITALIGAAAQSLKLINNALQSRITDKQHLMLAKIACCTPLLAIGCIMLADASAVFLAGRLPYVFVIDTTQDATLTYFINALPTLVLYIELAILNIHFLQDKVCAKLRASTHSKSDMPLLIE